MNKFLEEIHNILKQDERFFNDEGIILQNKIVESSNKFDKKLIKLLLGNKITKNKFFVKEDDILVFDRQYFNDVISSREIVNDSFTKFKNNLGLSLDCENYFKKEDRVTLIWPFKECVLSGGQTQEDKKREEKLFSRTLERDEIDRMLDKKVLTNFKRIDKNCESDLKSFNKF